MEKHDGLANDLKATYAELRTMGDEIRVQLHLAGMDAKDLWNRDLEPRLFSLEQRVEGEVSSATKAALHDLRDAMQKFRANLRRD
jgi:hypothetical protein